jgi:predicted MFS family arabinose efflux permease
MESPLGCALSSLQGKPARMSNSRRNFAAYVGSHVLTRFGDVLMNPKTTLTWLASLLGVPVGLQALLVPVREAGSLIAQPWLAGLVKRRRRRLGLWMLGALLQASTVASMAWLAAAEGLSSGAISGGVLLLLLALFALARGACSVTSKDLLGRAVEARLRGRASGLASSISGAGVVAGAALGWTLVGDDLEPARLALWLLVASACWVLGAAWFRLLDEPDAAADDGQTVGVALVLREPLLRRFVIARGLLLCSALAPPVFVSLAQAGEGSARELVQFILLGGLAGMLGGFSWGRLADRSSRWTLAVAAAAASVVTAAMAIAAWRDAASGWHLAAAFLLVSIAHEGVRVGRKTWIVNIASDEQRVDYVAASNAAMGWLLLVVGGISAAVATVSQPAMLGLLALCGAAGGLLGLRLPEARMPSD